MGWITERCHRTGTSIGGRTGKHKGPLRKVTRVLKHSTNLFEADFVEMECGHQGRGYGGARARYRECGKGDERYNSGHSVQDDTAAHPPPGKPKNLFQSFMSSSKTKQGKDFGEHGAV